MAFEEMYGSGGEGEGRVSPVLRSVSLACLYGICLPVEGGEEGVSWAVAAEKCSKAQYIEKYAIPFCFVQGCAEVGEDDVSCTGTRQKGREKNKI